MQEKEISLNHDTVFIRVVAFVAMLIDHVGLLFFPRELWLRAIGRIAFPLFCYGIVFGLVYSKNVKKYALRLFVFALISQYPYMLALNHSIEELNVLFTLLLGLIAIWGIRENKYGSRILAPALSLVLSYVITMDYGFKGVLFIIFAYMCRQSKQAFAAMMISFCLYWGTNSINMLYGLFNCESLFCAGLLKSIRPFFQLQTLALLALPFIIIDTDSGLKRIKHLGYLVYPGHLLILYFIQFL
ncbi:MAG: TraX family protein [Eubacteriales bacterium]|nr:TraX family protein [Eubacteriales bacterium]